MSVLYYLENIRTPVLNYIFTFFSLFGEPFTFIVILAILFWCFDKKTAYRIFFSYIIAGTVIQIIKVTFHIPRPWVRDHAFHAIPTAQTTATGYSFPSGHTLNTACISTCLFLNKRSTLLRILAVFFTIAVPLSRMYLGVHTPWDVIVALIITIALTFLVNRFIEGMSFDPAQYLRIGLIMLIFPFILLCTSLSLYYNNVVDFSNMIDAVKSSGVFTGFIVSWYFEQTYVHFNVRCDRVWKQFAKIGAGLFSMALTMGIFKLVFSFTPDAFWPGDFLTYFLTVVAGFGAYPLFIKHFFSAKY